MDAAEPPVSAWQRTGWAVSYCLAMLDGRDRRRFRRVVAVQMTVSVLDLVGVLLLGAVGVLASSVAAEQPPPAQIMNLLSLIGLGGLSVEGATVALAALATFFFLGKGLLSTYLLNRALHILAAGQIGVSERLTRRILSIPFFSLPESTSHDAAWTLGIGLQMTIGAMLGSVAVALSELALLGLLLVALLVISPGTTIALVIYFGIIGFFMHRYLGRWSHRVEARIASNYVRGQQMIQEAIQLFPELKASGRRTVFSDRISLRLANTAKYSADQAFIAQLPKFAYETALVVGMVAIAGWQLREGNLEAVVGVLAVFLAAGVRLLPSLIRFQNSLVSIRARTANTVRVRDFVDSLPPEQEPEQDQEFDVVRFNEGIRAGHPDFKGTVEIQDVTFTYSGAARPSLINFSIEVATGETVAITGPTGAGKSTAVGLILGIFQPVAGTVLVDGSAPDAITKRSAGAIAYVPQSICLIHGSVRENVALGVPRERIADDDVWRALEQAHLAPFLAEARDGLDTEIGEHGTQLSGGQRQRLGLARALYSRPRLIILDEATSALDERTESMVSETLAGLRGQATVITVAHRISTMRAADRVIFVAGGRKVDEGPYDDLYARCDQFRDMVTRLPDASAPTSPTDDS